MSRADNIIKKFEGLRLKAYRDSTGRWTIGYGHTKGVVYGDRITNEKAEAFLQEDLALALRTIKATVKVPLNANQHSAIASLIFNIGPGAWKTSTALRRLNAKNYTGAVDAMAWFHKSRKHGVLTRNQGLVNRREMERTLYLTVTPLAAPGSPARGAITGGEAKPLIKSKTQWLAGAGLAGVAGNSLSTLTDIRFALPELVWTIGPLVVLGLIFAAILLNRWYDSRKGVH